jgi:predicted transcriptional regulator
MKSLTKAEEQIMEAIWKIKSGFLKDIIDALPSPKPHANTVGTIVKILVDKKYVTYDQQGRNNLYKAAITRERYAKRSMASVMNTFFDGSPAQVVSHFIEDNKLTVPELEALLKKIQSSKK